MPLTLAKAGDTVIVERITGKDEIRSHLADLGFVPGAEIEVVQSQGGNIIVKVKGSRLAITKEMAAKILVAS